MTFLYNPRALSIATTQLDGSRQLPTWAVAALVERALRWLA
jgi:hypothetical protein